VNAGAVQSKGQQQIATQRRHVGRSAVAGGELPGPLGGLGPGGRRCLPGLAPLGAGPGLTGRREAPSERDCREPTAGRRGRYGLTRGLAEDVLRLSAEHDAILGRNRSSCGGM
jgi:hypothetical protein